MSETQTGKAGGVPDQELMSAETQTGQALAAIHRLLARLDDTSATTEVQAAFKRALASLELARQAHFGFMESRKPITAQGSAGVAGETVAVITAAIAAVFGRSFRVVNMQKVPAPAPHLNVWALEGRTQIFQSHRIR